MIDRESLTQEAKYLGFKKAFDVYSKYVQDREYLAAYVVAFSIFEDRVTASFMLAKDLSGKQRPNGFVNLGSKIKFLCNCGHLQPSTSRKWKSAAKERNHHLHAAMWSPDAITDTMCNDLLRNAREADKVSRMLSRKISE